MTAQIPMVKELSDGQGDRLIRVLVADQKGDGFHALTFPESEIQGVAEMEQDRSALVLRSGVEISVALPHEQLEEKIYHADFRHDGLEIDLRGLTGQAAIPKTASANEAPPEPNVGDMVRDATIFAGISPETNKAMYTTPTDAPLAVTFDKATEYAAKLNAYGHQDWRMPTKAELQVLFNNRAAIGGFNVSGSPPAGWYWSASSIDDWNAWAQLFSVGSSLTSLKANLSAVRCVR